MNFTCFFFGVIFIALGLLFYGGETHVLDFMVPERKDLSEAVIKRLCHNAGLVIVICGIIFLGNFFSDRHLLLSMSIWFIAVLVDVFYVTKSSRYK